MSTTINATIASFDGTLLKVSHPSTVLSCTMNFNLYLPFPVAKKAYESTSNVSSKVPLLVYLAGLTCTGDNGAEKGFFQRTARELGIAVLYPDTSPRGLGIKGEDDDWDFGTGAGFYVDAVKEPYSKGYKMYTYITQELPSVVFKNFEVVDSKRVSIFGHSMGGHGALTLFLKNPGMYKSVSAFAPIANPMESAWGQKAFKGYFGDNKDLWAEYDATELIKRWKGEPLDIIIDVGTADSSYQQGQLLPENLVKAAEGKGSVKLRKQENYDHGYFTISTFGEDHIRHAAKFLLK